MCQTMIDFYKKGQKVGLKNGAKGIIFQVFGGNNNDIRPIVQKLGYLTVKLQKPHLGMIKIIPANAEVIYNNEVTPINYTTC